MALSTAELQILLQARDELSPALTHASSSLSSFQHTATAPLGALGSLASGMADVAKTAAGFVIGQAFTQLPGQLMAAAKAAADDAQSTVLLQQAVKNAGQSWDVYGGQLQAVAENGLRLGFADEQTRAALALLTAQTGSAEEAQKRLSMAQDLSRGTGMDLTTASRLLGKVTDENVNVLARYGISMRKGADDTELFGAVQKKFGGQAEAFANSSAGAFAALQLQLGEMQESLGTAVMPLLTALATFANKTLVPIFQDQLAPALQSVGETLAGVVGPAIEGVQGLFAAFTVDAGGMGIVLASIRTVFGDTVADGIEPFVQAFMRAIPRVQEFAGWISNTLLGTLSSLRDWMGDRLQAVFAWWTDTAWPGIQLAAETVRSWMEGTLFPTLGRIKEWLQDSAGGAIEWWIGTAWPNLQRVWEALSSFITVEVVPKLMALKEWLGDRAGDAITWWTGTAWPALQAAWAALSTYIEATVVPALVDLKAKFDDSATSAAGLAVQVRENLQPALQGLSSDAGKLGAWENLRAAWDALTGAGTELRTVWDGLMSALGGGKSGVEGVGTAAETSGGQFNLAAEMIAKYARDVKDIADSAASIVTAIRLVGDAFNAVGQAADRAGGFIKTLKDQLAGGSSLTDVAIALGTNIGTSLRQGVQSQLSPARDVGAELGNATVEGAADALEARSPSLKFVVMGQNVVEGLNLGILQNLPKVKESGAQLSQALLDGAKDTLGASTDLTAYIKQAAAKYGIDWHTAIKVAMSEGGVKPGAIGDSGSSFGPFQLHKGGIAGGGNAVSGMGDAFQQLTGLDPANIQTTWAQIDFAMSQAAEHGWSAWHGATAAGIADFEGIGTAAKSMTSSLSATGATYGDEITNQMASYAKAVDDIGQRLQENLSDLTIKTGERLAENGQQAIDTIVGIMQTADDAINRIGGSLADPASRTMQEQALQASLDLTRQFHEQTRADADAASKYQRDLAKADADNVKAIATENRTYARDLENAKTQQQRDAIEDRHKDRLLDLGVQLKDNKQALTDRYKDSQADLEQRRKDDADDKKWVQDNIIKPMTEFKQQTAILERDDKIKKAQEAADANFKTIEEGAVKERARLLQSAKDKIADTKAEFLDKLPPLTEEAMKVINAFLENVDKGIGDLISDGSLKLVRADVDTIKGYLAEIPTEINTKITVSQASNALEAAKAQAGGGGGGGGGGSSGGGGGGGGSSGGYSQEYLSSQENRANLRNEGYQVGSEGGQYYAEKTYDSGGWLMPGLTLANNQSGRPERVMAPGSGGAAIVWTGNVIVQGNVQTQTDLVNGIHRELLQKLARNGSLGF